MIDRRFSTFVFSILLSTSLLAQQSGSNAGAQTLTSSDQNAQHSAGSDREKLEAPRSADFWDGEEPSIVNLMAHPLTTKKYVQRHVAPIRDRVNELDEIANYNRQQIRDIDARAQQGLRLASEKTSLADQHATDAATRAESAKSAATLATTRLDTLEQRVGSLDQHRASMQTEIRFRPGQNALSKQAKDALDQMSLPLKEQHNYIIEVQGFAPGHGQAAITASRNMADAVARYLIFAHDIPMYRIYVVGMGDAPSSSQGGSKRVSGGRVEVSLLKNDAH